MIKISPQDSVDGSLNYFQTSCHSTYNGRLQITNPSQKHYQDLFRLAPTLLKALRAC